MENGSGIVSYNTALDRIEETQNEYYNKAKKIYKGTYTTALLLFVIACVVLYFEKVEFVYFLVPFAIVVVISFFVIITVKSVYRSKIINQVINLEIVRLYNMEHDTNLQYEYRPKVSKDFNVDMGLFTRYASVRSRYRITGTSPNHMNFELLNCTLVTSNGKSSTVHFDGIYVRLFMKNKPSQQIRSKGKPHATHIKMVQQEQYEERVFVPEEHPETVVDTMLLGIFRNIPSNFTISSYYVASNTNEVVIAFSPKGRHALPEEFNYTTFQEYAEPLMSYLDFIYESMSQLEDTY